MWKLFYLNQKVFYISVSFLEEFIESVLIIIAGIIMKMIFWIIQNRPGYAAIINNPKNQWHKTSKILLLDNLLWPKQTGNGQKPKGIKNTIKRRAWKMQILKIFLNKWFSLENIRIQFYLGLLNFHHLARKVLKAWFWSYKRYLCSNQLWKE